jgi:HPt (histidine-containing phosphotransfer) domain-containing protein
MKYQYINLQYFDDNFDAEDSFVREILSIYLADVPARMQQLHLQIQSKAWDKAAQTAHSIKASVKMLGIEDFLNIIETIERLVLLPGHEEETYALYDQAAQVMMEANAEINHFLAES